MNNKPATTVPESDEPIVAEDLLRAAGATEVHLARGERVFDVGDRASYFYQVLHGRVKMTVLSERGREFVQGYFTRGQSFGEPPFFVRGDYPASALAVEQSRVLRIGYDEFTSLLRSNPNVALRVIEVLSARLMYKAMMLGEIAVEEAEHRLATIIDYLGRSEGSLLGGRFQVPFTRQQLADMTGLRVETVIRTIKAMEEKGMLEIRDGKIVWLPLNNMNSNA